MSIQPENIDDDPEPLTDAELTALEDLSYAATMRPWQIERIPLKTSELGASKGYTADGVVETTIHTLWDHGQAKGPAPVLTTAWGPFYEPSRMIYIRKEDADFIVGACNATRRLLAEVRRLRSGDRPETAIAEEKKR